MYLVLSIESYSWQVIMLVTLSATASMMPGIHPALNIDSIDWSAVTAYVTIGIEGGITTPRVPADAAIAATLSLG